MYYIYILYIYILYYIDIYIIYIYIQRYNVYIYIYMTHSATLEREHLKGILPQLPEVGLAGRAALAARLLLPPGAPSAGSGIWFFGKPWGKSWENNRKPWENHRKTMENHRKPWKTMGKSWENHGKMEVYPLAN